MLFCFKGRIRTQNLPTNYRFPMSICAHTTLFEDDWNFLLVGSAGDITWHFIKHIILKNIFFTSELQDVQHFVRAGNFPFYPSTSRSFLYCHHTRIRYRREYRQTRWILRRSCHGQGSHLHSAHEKKCLESDVQEFRGSNHTEDNTK